jgi:ankyrin repeat protein
MAQMDFFNAELFLKGEDPDNNGKQTDPNVCYEGTRMTALHIAALNDDIKSARLLLKYSADREFKSEEGQMALGMAMERNLKRAVAMLTEE